MFTKSPFTRAISSPINRATPLDTSRFVFEKRCVQLVGRHCVARSTGQLIAHAKERLDDRHTLPSLTDFVLTPPDIYSNVRLLPGPVPFPSRV